MGKIFISGACAAGLLLALGVYSAEAGGRGGGGPGGNVAPFTPPGFSQGNKNGFETFTNTTPATIPTGTPTTTSMQLPHGWGEGKADWKSSLEQPNPVLNTVPPGLSR
jgi:hypothetical protein